MKKTLVTLLFATIAIALKAETVYTIDAVSTPTGGSTLEGYGIKVALKSGSTTFASGKGNTIKYSAGKTYTITLPSTAKITKVKLYGYGNVDNTDTYLASFGGKSYSSSQYVFRTRTTLTAEPYDTKEISFSTPLTGSIDFSFAGAQACIIISLTSDEEASPEQGDEYSRGKYSNPATGGVTPTGATKLFDYPTKPGQMEKLDRGVVALPEMNGKGIVVTWRLFGTDGLGAASKTTFDVLRNGEIVGKDLATVTNFTDATGTKSDKYVVVTKVNGVETERSEAVTPWNRIYKTIQLDLPTDTRGLGVKYSPNDMSVGDLDGDGQYELVVKWNPTNSRDNSQSDITGTVYLDAYKLDGTKLWRVDMGKNVRAGAHYTQFLVYDFDGDGKAEMMCKTAPGTKDGKGNYVSEAGDATIQATNNSQTCYNSAGHITTGEEFLTVFSGMTGEALNTIWYNPNRKGTSFPTKAEEYGGSSVWGDTNQNRGNRFNAAVAHLGGAGENPSAIFQRGYYTKCYLWAVDWDGKELTTRWLHRGTGAKAWNVVDANNKMTGYGTNASTYGQGVHGISVGDVNNDGYDEIVLGPTTIDHEGKLLCYTGMGHGDAIHLADLCPDRPGLEVMMPHEEENSYTTYGYDVHDATTGEIIYKANSSADNGRGLAADVLSSSRGYEFWSSAESNVRSCVNGTSLGTRRPSVNFRIYWDGDLQDELFDGHHKTSTDDALKQTDINGTCAAAIEKLTSASSYATLLSLSSSAYGNGKTCNTTKSTPSLQADILGDWREELVLWDGNDPSVINIYSSNVPTTYRVPTLMHDHLYRMGIAWQNSSYNQPPHLGYYLPDMFDKNYGVYSEAYKEAHKVVKGDVDGDGYITMSDANAVVNRYLGVAVTPFIEEAADMDGDGSITMSDANAIVNKYLGVTE